MTILYMHEANGAFVVGDTFDGRTSYAYPTSSSATRALRSPMTVAYDMLKREMKRSDVPASLRADVELIDRNRMPALRTHGTAIPPVGKTPEYLSGWLAWEAGVWNTSNPHIGGDYRAEMDWRDGWMARHDIANGRG